MNAHKKEKSLEREHDYVWSLLGIILVIMITMTMMLLPLDQSDGAVNITESGNSTGTLVETQNSTSTDEDSDNENDNGQQNKTANDIFSSTENNSDATQMASTFLSGTVMRTYMPLLKNNTGTSAAASSGIHISALEVSKIVDGTGPFDSDDSDGNDSSSSNRVCRTFDTISYTLGYVTALDDTSVQVSSAVISASFVLDCDPHEAQFDSSGMTWAENATITYFYSDGSSSTSWDKARTVTKQVFEANRTLAGKSSDDRVPGAGQLSATVKVLNAENGSSMKPSFSLSCAGSDVTKTIEPESVRVSSKLKLDLRYEYGATESARNPLYLSEANNTWNVLDTDPDNTVKSRVYANSIGICLYNDSTSKGMKGLALPSGPITFDIRNSCTLDGVDVTHGTDYRYLLWDYRDDNTKYSRSDSGFGRTVDLISSQYSWEKTLPLNNGNPIGSDSRHSCYHGGHFMVQQDASDSALLHVTLDGYDFDYDNWSFPKTHGPSSYTTLDFPANELYFSVLDIQNAAIYPRTVDSTLNYELKSNVENLKASTSSGDKTTEMQRKSFRKNQNTKIVLYQPGSFVSRTYWTCHNEATSWGSGRCYAGIGESPNNSNSMTYNGTENVKAMDHLFKFDTEVLDLVNQGGRSSGQHGEKVGSCTLLFAAKPDGSGWTDFKEQRSAKIQNLVYYKTKEDLEKAGKKCVGLLLEYRDIDFISFRDWSPVWASFKVRSDATPGYVAVSTNCTAVWNKDGQENPGSVLDHDNGDGSYGKVNANTDKDTYDDYSSQPSVMQEFSDYEPTRYSNGTMSGGHTNGVNHGDSLLIVGDKTSVTMEIADTDDDDEQKSVYDLDAGERTVNVVVHPKLSLISSDSSGKTTGTEDDVTLTITVPKGLTYTKGSSNIVPKTSTENTDGTTTLVFEFLGQKVGEEIPDVYFSCYIGDPGTENDAQNNQEFSFNSRITSVSDPSSSNDPTDPHKATASFRVVRLSALSVSKRVSKEHSNPNESYEWYLRVSNTSDTDTQNMGIADVLPYDSDDRGTSIVASSPRLFRIEIDLSHAPKTEKKISGLSKTLTLVTGASSSFPTDVIKKRATNGDMSSVINKGTLSSYSLSDATENDGVYTYDTSSVNMSNGITAFYIALGDLASHEYVDVNLYMDYPDNGEESGSKYVNQFVEDSDLQPDTVISNAVVHDVLELSVPLKKVWIGKGSTAPSVLSMTFESSDGKTFNTTVSEEDGWQKTVKLPAYSDDGETITWKLEENWSDPFYYEPEITGDQENGFIVTNRSMLVSMPTTGENGNIVLLSCIGMIMILIPVLTAFFSGIIGRREKPKNHRND